MSKDTIKSIYYEFLSYFVPQKVKYTIEGECVKCGECCRNIRSYYLKNEKELNIMKFFIPSYKRFFIIGKDENENLILSCKYLSKEGLCTVYKKRPNLCRKYPQKQINLNLKMPEHCGFKITKKEFKDYL